MLSDQLNIVKNEEIKYRVVSSEHLSNRGALQADVVHTF